MSYTSHFQDFRGPPFPVLQTSGWMFWGAERNVRLQEETHVCSNTGQTGANTINGVKGCNFKRSQISWFLVDSTLYHHLFLGGRLLSTVHTPFLVLTLSPEAREPFLPLKGLKVDATGEKKTSKCVTWEGTVLGAQERHSS